MIDSDLQHPGMPATSLARHLEFLTDLAGGRLPALLATALTAAPAAELAQLGLDLAVESRLLPAEVGTAEYEPLVGVHAANLAALAEYQPSPVGRPSPLLVAIP